MRVIEPKLANTSSTIVSENGKLRMKKMGVMRFVYVIIDYSVAMLDQSLFPNLITVSMGRVKNFVQNFFQFNPIAQIGLILCNDRKPNRDSRVLNDALDSLDYAACTGDFSLQTSLNLALQDLQGQPSYASREIICVMVIGLTAEMYACKKLCDSTGGRYDVVMNDNHFREIFDEHMKPVIMPGDTGSDLIPVCFPTREAVFAPPAHKDDFSQLDQTFVCQQCGANFCSTPAECTVCGILLITAPQLARAFQHLVELDKFEESTNFESSCYACQVSINEKAFLCGKCGATFCSDCNDLTHKLLQYAQLVVGPAGSGKSTYCHTIQEHCRSIQRQVFVINLDPAADSFKYQCDVDVRDLISVQDVQEDEELILEQINEAEDDYFLIDCPGQIELYSHLPVMRQFVNKLQSWGFNVCTVFLLDSQFLLDSDKFIAGALTTLSTMVSLETPAVNVISKMDMVNDKDREFLDLVVEGNAQMILDHQEPTPWSQKNRKLTEIIANILDEYSLVHFKPLNPDDEDQVTELLLTIDNTIQYGEDLDVQDRIPDDVDPDEPDLGYDDS
ncbi:GPN-loop GTPase 3 [Aphelenchoides besseyi]|nr:GPN-loop GTPase 3 [Aphelenchoides besseyi]